MQNKISDENILLCILDGWGIAPDSPYNAISQAYTPTYDFLSSNYPSSKLNASGISVGLPLGQMGNSEVGHLTIGAGRSILQPLERIDLALDNGDIYKIAAFKKTLNDLRDKNSKCHIIGICSDGGVHGHINHLLKMAKIIAKENIKVELHLIADGRDTKPYSILTYLENVNLDNSLIQIASVTGRYFAMDRDNNWERTEIAYNAITNAHGIKTINFNSVIQEQYNSNVSDEFLSPIIRDDYNGISKNDSIIITNFRPDRIRQIATALSADNNFNQFDNSKAISSIAFRLSMTSYSKELDNKFIPLIENQKLNNSLGEIISKSGFNQIRIAETEKYAHVTYFFNAGMEQPFDNEDRVLVPSKKIATYDLDPAMSSEEICNQIISALNKKKYKLIICNFAAPDMVGHTGNLEATIKAVEIIDSCLKKIFDQITNTNTTMIITSDHGNCEEMRDLKTSEIVTAHTLNFVPFIIVNDKILKNNILPQGDLTDIAPTILNILNLEKPQEMTGKSLLI